MDVAVVIIARDAKDVIGRSLKSVAGLTDEVLVVVDDRTIDTTAEVAKNSGALVLTRKFVDFSSQKNFAAGEVHHCWILSIDADEVATPELITAIKALPELPLFTAYLVPRKNIIFQKIINYTNWDPNGLVRLYNRQSGHWEGPVHESIVTQGTIGKLYDPLIHYNYSTVEQFMQKQNDYSQREASGKNFSLTNFFFYPLLDFIRRFILHTGFLDGWHGFFLSYLMVIYHLSVWVKVWQKSKST